MTHKSLPLANKGDIADRKEFAFGKHQALIRVFDKKQFSDDEKYFAIH